MIPTADDAFDVVLACLSVMFVVDRAAAVREIARVLRPGGRIVAAVWAGPEVLGFDFSDLTAAWEVLAGVTAVGLPGGASHSLIAPRRIRRS
jgi:SAM-dependent methyltransferase